MKDFSFINLHFSFLAPFSFVITYTLEDFETSVHLLSVVVKRAMVTALRKDLLFKDTRLGQLFLSLPLFHDLLIRQYAFQQPITKPTPKKEILIERDWLLAKIPNSTMKKERF